MWRDRIACYSREMFRNIVPTAFAALVAASTISLAPPARAQIGNIFSDPAPRPPGNIPRGGNQPQPDDEEEVPELPQVFFFNDTAPTEIYTLSLHDALPIWTVRTGSRTCSFPKVRPTWIRAVFQYRSEEHTSELQSLPYLVCPLLLEQK